MVKKALGTSVHIAWLLRHAIKMADTRGRALSPSRAIRNRSREKDRVKEPEKSEEKPSIDREKVLFEYGCFYIEKEGIGCQLEVIMSAVNVLCCISCLKY